MKKLEILKQYFGYDSFREGQEPIIDGILAGRDTLGIMPTGAGKSMCFQLPALLFPGITLVISPLISLMKDQVQSLIVSGIPAAFINSSLTPAQTMQALELAKKGKYKIMYVAPERLEMQEFIAFAMQANISMVTIDEAHCISQWGQNFRPSYLKIREFLLTLPKLPVVSAFTATATKEVKEDIIELLDLHNPLVQITGFDRENLYFEVQKPVDKYEFLHHYIIKKQDNSGIIYCATRKTVEEVCVRLINDGFEATRYHAGLSDIERTKNQDDFLYDSKKIMVATNAFGMGIDKSNVSYVVHYNMPKSMEHYYQEAGRAGRDGSDAECILLYNGQDVVMNRILIDNQNDTSELDVKTQELVKQKDRERLKQMTYYCHTSECLRAYILSYFGDRSSNYCGNCSTCSTEFEEVDITKHAQMVLSCIVRLQERFGINMLIDTLRGSQTAKIRSAGIDKISTYGIMRDLTSSYVRDVINHLILDGYITITDSEYPIVKLSPIARDILLSKTSVIMKTKKIKEDILFESKKKNVSRNKKQSMKLFDANPVDESLLEKLKELRLVIASNKGVPAFVIFSNATLYEMASRKPVSEDEFLQVSGVGKVKLEQYGNMFMEMIRTHSSDEEPKTVLEKEKLTLTDLCEVIKKEIEITDEPITISRLTDKINVILLTYHYRNITAKGINDALIKKGLLESKDWNDKIVKVPSMLGMELGMYAVEKHTSAGESYLQVVYDTNAQRYVIGHIEEILMQIF